MIKDNTSILNAFCIDLEEWFHICGIQTAYSNMDRWDEAPSRVEQNTDVLLSLLDEARTKGTFLAVGWIADKYPRLIRRISDLGHEIGCHGYSHQLIYEQTPAQFRNEISQSRKVLQDSSGQPVTAFRAPGFSMKRQCLWAYPILAEEGITVDVSIVPAVRDHGGVSGLSPRPFLLKTGSGLINVFPVSVMQCLGKTTPFSGGGYLRLFPMPLIRYGFRQNHKQGLPVMAYIHPREIDPDQPRMKLPAIKGFKYYINLKSTKTKLSRLLREYRFGTVEEVIGGFDFQDYFELIEGDFQPHPGKPSIQQSAMQSTSSEAILSEV